MTSQIPHFQDFILSKFVSTVLSLIVFFFALAHAHLLFPGLPFFFISSFPVLFYFFLFSFYFLHSISINVSLSFFKVFFLSSYCIFLSLTITILVLSLLIQFLTLLLSSNYYIHIITLKLFVIFSLFLCLKFFLSCFFFSLLPSFSFSAYRSLSISLVHLFYPPIASFFCLRSLLLVLILSF